ncbi:hypothetical protein BBI01_10710 [Chryseobacterium artocarpi]|uniref:ABC transporter permease n=1 Tax=Chryseobacterium artocarpi TaxID=1414727 RepID=A0A1B8ZLV8_9FLAO|nr:hypothetical protein [Chryseobacterium artocarpi]OCA72575.1 hypothetical protein BBI01_10710 [Chryseobacterium artocarpi]
MEKLINHFQFRFRQCFRLLNLNPRRSVPVLIVLGALIAVKLPENYYYPGMFFGLIILFHYERKDIPFLKKVFVQSWRWVVVLEATMIYSALLLGNINYTIEKIGLGLYALMVLFAFISPRTQPRATLQWNFIPDNLFEWKGFLRKNSWMGIIGFVIVLLSSYHPATLILAGVFVLDYISHIYEPHENKEMLEMYFKKYTLKEKIRKNSLFFNILLLPVYCSFLILNPYESFYILYYFAFMNLYFLLILTRKYKNYNHKNKNGDYGIGVYLEYFVCCMTIIPAVLILRSSMKAANHNIRTYVGD